MTDLGVLPTSSPVAPDQASMLYPPAPPTERDIMQSLGDARRKTTADLPTQVVDPSISPRDRLLVGARVYAGKQGVDLDGYEAWRTNRKVDAVAQPPVRAGVSSKQASLLATPDDRTAQAKALRRGIDDVAAARIGGWIESYEQGVGPGAPVDVARFDRVASDGLLSGRAATLYEDLLNGSIVDVDAAELTSKVSQVARALDAFDDDLTIGRTGRLVGVDADQDVRVRVRYEPDEEPVSAPGALQALPGDWLPQSSLKGSSPTGDDIDVYVGAADAVVIARNAKRIDAVFRKGFPAVEANGATRWMSARPTLVTDPAAIRHAAVRNPTAVVETHLSTYPGFLPYDSITFELGAKSPRVEELGGVRLGRGISEGPRLSARLVQQQELVDVGAVARLLAETQWAIFDDAVPAKLHPRYEPIPVRSGDRTGLLVFGISPAEASQVADWAFVNDGIATRRDDYDDIADAQADLTQWEVRTADRGAYPIAVSLDESPLVVERRSRAVDRWHLPIDERSRGYIGGLADHLETLGASNVVVYASLEDVEGFEQVREHVYGDGGSGYHVARTADPTVGDPNGLPVWVRPRHGLPTRWLQVDRQALDSMIEEMTARQRQSEQVWEIDARGLDDIGPQVRAAHVLGQKYGYERVALVGDDGPITIARPKR